MGVVRPRPRPVRPSLRPAALWSRFHHGREAGFLCLLGGVLTWFSDGIVVQQLGYVSLTFGVPAPLFLSALPGIAVGVAALQPSHPGAAPWTPRHRLLQQAWLIVVALVGWTCLAVATQAWSPAALRNVLCVAGVSMLAARLGREAAVWLPGVAWVILATLAGRAMEGPVGIALLLDPIDRPGHWALAAILWGLGAGTIITSDPRDA